MDARRTTRRYVMTATANWVAATEPSPGEVGSLPLCREFLDVHFPCDLHSLSDSFNQCRQSVLVPEVKQCLGDSVYITYDGRHIKLINEEHRQTQNTMVATAMPQLCMTVSTVKR